MPAITYNALRSIERVSFELFSSLTLSVNSAGSPNVSTFNDSSSPGSLAGLNVNEWILVSGFSNTLNNGWHQVSGSSTASTITVNSILVSEPAGNSITILGYLRGKNQSYSFDVSFTSDDRMRKVSKFTNIAIDGNTETLTQRRTESFNITSSVLDTGLTDYPQWIEFLDSCESGETFVFDRVGSVAVPDNILSAVLDGEGYTEQRLENITGRRISFKVRIL